MEYHIKIKEEYWINLSAAFEYYSSINEELGIRFYRETDSLLSEISIQPLSFQIQIKNYRQALVKNFPFQIIFELFENEIIIYTLFPAKANPAKKPK